MAANPAFRPRGWMEEPPPLDAFGTLIFQVAGQQLSVAATRTIVTRIEQRFGGRLPWPAELLAADPQVLRAAGLSARKGATLRSEEHTSELQSHLNLVCRLLLEKKNLFMSGRTSLLMIVYL